MWHEARRQEKKLRGMMVDFKKRAERRRAYYERMVGTLYFILFAISSGKIEAKMTRFESLISELYLIGSWLVYSYFVLCAHADVMIHVPIFC